METGVRSYKENNNRKQIRGFFLAWLCMAAFAINMRKKTSPDMFYSPQLKYINDWWSISNAGTISKHPVPVFIVAGGCCLQTSAAGFNLT